MGHQSWSQSYALDLSQVRVQLNIITIIIWALPNFFGVGIVSSTIQQPFFLVVWEAASPTSFLHRSSSRSLLYDIPLYYVVSWLCSTLFATMFLATSQSIMSFFTTFEIDIDLPLLLIPCSYHFKRHSLIFYFIGAT